MSALAGAAVLLVTILLAAFFWARARRRARPEPFSLAAPSPPLVREAVAALAGSVHTFRTSAAAARGGPGCTAACAAKLAQVEAALAPADELFRLPPTLANHLATYRGLQDAPADLEALADGLRAE
ncbi:MAG TPA: hypothetical protein VNI01_02975, partial [Elusimicrobiota bacterium]|nr:hypothetical protein [Elusimicrobiota bacterium]